MTEDICSWGRAELAVRHAAGECLFEFKVAERAALAQVRAKGYAEKYLGGGRPVHLVWVEFSSDSRNVERFEAERVH